MANLIRGHEKSKRLHTLNIIAWDKGRQLSLVDPGPLPILRKRPSCTLILNPYQERKRCPFTIAAIPSLSRISDPIMNPMASSKANGTWYTNRSSQYRTAPHNTYLVPLSDKVESRITYIFESLMDEWIQSLVASGMSKLYTGETFNALETLLFGYGLYHLGTNGGSYHCQFAWQFFNMIMDAAGGYDSLKDFPEARYTCTYASET